VLTSHSSVELAGWSMTRAPVDHLAIGLLISSEMIEPVKPTTSENTSSAPTLIPGAAHRARCRARSARPTAPASPRGWWRGTNDALHVGASQKWVEQAQDLPNHKELS
jgi:hypothetical protein